MWLIWSREGLPGPGITPAKYMLRKRNRRMMLAARQLIGLSSATSTLFCTCCLLPIQDIENLDKSTWPARDLVEQIEKARRWRDFGNEGDRYTYFKEHGVRWSVLLELPYWNPILFSVIAQCTLLTPAQFSRTVVGCGRSAFLQMVVRGRLSSQQQMFRVQLIVFCHNG